MNCLSCKKELRPNGCYWHFFNQPLCTPCAGTAQRNHECLAKSMEQIGLKDAAKYFYRLAGVSRK